MESTLLWLAMAGPYIYPPIQVFEDSSLPPTTLQIFDFLELTFLLNYFLYKGTSWSAYKISTQDLQCVSSSSSTYAMAAGLERRIFPFVLQKQC